MNSQRNLNTVRSLIRTASYLSPKEKAMNRRIATVLFALLTALVLSACAVPSPFQTTGRVTVLPKEAAPLMAGQQINDRQQLTDYQASLPAYVALPVSATPVVKDSELQINARQQLADYQASLPLYVGKKTASTTTAQPMTDRQWLADYQVTLR